MQIFDAILNQYMQLALETNQYKNNLRILNFSQNYVRPSANNTSTIFNTKSQKTIVQNIIADYNQEDSNIKEIYDKMEFDARRYNRNFDIQTGAAAL